MLYYIWQDFPIRWSTRCNFPWGISLDQKECGRQAALYNSFWELLDSYKEELLDRLAAILAINDTLSIRRSLCPVGRGKREWYGNTCCHVFHPIVGSNWKVSSTYSETVYKAGKRSQRLYSYALILKSFWKCSSRNLVLSVNLSFVQWKDFFQLWMEILSLTDMTVGFPHGRSGGVLLPLDIPVI